MKRHPWHYQSMSRSLALIMVGHTSVVGTCAKGATISGALARGHEVNALSRKADSDFRKQLSRSMRIYRYLLSYAVCSIIPRDLAIVVLLYQRVVLSN